jgi:hypothetical protein
MENRTTDNIWGYSCFSDFADTPESTPSTAHHDFS